MSVRLFLFGRTRDELEEAIRKDHGKSLDSYVEDLKPAKVITAGEECISEAFVKDDKLSRIKGEFDSVPKGYRVVFEVDPKDAERFADSLKGNYIGVDLPISGVSVPPIPRHWCAGVSGQHSFMDRGAANRLMGAAGLGLPGNSPVNVIVVDQGLNEAVVNAIGNSFGAAQNAFAGGLEIDGRQPGTYDDPHRRSPSEHGHMVVRNILSLAPNARIWDVPLIPRRIDNVNAYLVDAAFAYFLILLWLGLVDDGSEDWIVVNAWAIFDRGSEVPLGHYTTDPTHPVNWLVRALAARADVVFGAGNSGQFCPDRRSGAYDRGPGQSIWGANALEEVYCIGATRSDGYWVGTASQGPGPAALSAAGGVNEKPDVCAPSWFTEPSDPTLNNSGTSAACALATGILAALRSNPKWRQAPVPPAAMKQRVRETALPILQQQWNSRLGTGVIHFGRLTNRLMADFP